MIAAIVGNITPIVPIQSGLFLKPSLTSLLNLNNVNILKLFSIKYHFGR